MVLPDGQQIDRFRVEVRLGQGSIAQVYKATDLSGGRAVALKLVDSPLGMDPGFQRGVLEIAHEPTIRGERGLLPIEEARLIGDRLALTMEYMAGGSLAGLFWRPPGSRRDLVARLRLCADAAGTLGALHSIGLPHGGVTPGNLLLAAPLGETPATLRVGDFGLAVHASTRMGRLVGNPIYCAPERFDAQVSPASDIYSLGVILYEAITGQPPFQGASIAETARKHRQEPPPPLSLFQTNLPASLEAAVLRCLAKDLAGRFLSGAELSSALRLIIEELDPPPAQAARPPLPATELLDPSAPRVHVLDAQGSLVSSHILRQGQSSAGRRSHNAIVLPSDNTVISREHLSITWDGHCVRVEDRSSNGTARRDGSRLHARVAEPWQWHEELLVGEFVLVLIPPPAASPTQIAAPPDPPRSTPDP